jgi:diadenosine tetraphosphate (Ap4A) HIT family hydrolase
MDVDAGCPVCRAVRGDPPGPVIYDDGLWRVTPAPASTAAPGALALTTIRHVPSLAELSGAEAAALGPLLARLAAALQVETGANRVDVATFADTPAAEARHLCLHLIPRGPGAPAVRDAVALARRVADRLRAHRERAV